jgi:hypothetical protein
MDGKEEQPPSVESPKGVEANGLSAMDAISRETVDLVLLLLLTYCSPPLISDRSFLKPKWDNRLIAGAHPRGGGLRPSQVYQGGTNQ